MPIGGLFADIIEEPMLSDDMDLGKIVSENNFFTGMEVTYYATNGGRVGVVKPEEPIGFAGAWALADNGNDFLGWVDSDGEYLSDNEYFRPDDSDELKTFYAVFSNIDKITNTDIETQALAIASQEPGWTGGTIQDETAISENTIEETSDDIFFEDSNVVDDIIDDFAEEYNNIEEAPEDSNNMSEENYFDDDNEMIISSTDSSDTYIEQSDSFDEGYQKNYDISATEPDLHQNEQNTDGVEVEINTDTNSINESNIDNTNTIEDKQDTEIFTEVSEANHNIDNENVARLDSTKLAEGKSTDILPDNEASSDIAPIEQNKEAFPSLPELEINISQPEEPSDSSDKHNSSDNSEDVVSPKKVYCNILCVERTTNDIIEQTEPVQATAGSKITVEGNLGDDYELDSLGVFKYIAADSYENGGASSIYSDADDIVDYDKEELSCTLKSEPSEDMTIVYYMQMTALGGIRNQINEVSDNGISQEITPAIILLSFVALLFVTGYKRKIGL